MQSMLCILSRTSTAGCRGPSDEVGICGDAAAGHQGGQGCSMHGWIGSSGVDARRVERLMQRYEGLGQVW